MSHKLNLNPLITFIHRSPLELSLTLTGGGSRLASELLSVPGASNSILNVTIPYSRCSLRQFLGFHPENYCSQATAASLAMKTFQDAQCTNPSDHYAVGLTASLSSSPSKKGKLRFHLSIQGQRKTRWVSAAWPKGCLTRNEEEQLIVQLGLLEIYNLIAKDPEVYSPPEGVLVTSEECQAPQQWREVFEGKTMFCHATDTQQFPSTTGILSGSFNPIHDGHRQMAQVYQKVYGEGVDYELSITNPDKPPLDFLSLQRRIAKFENESLWITRAPTFAEKAVCFPNHHFLVGADTIQRIGDPAYYKDSEALDDAVQTIRSQGCRFVVFAREQAGQLLTVQDLDLGANLKSLCDSIPVSSFLNNQSSTAIRKPSI